MLKRANSYPVSNQVNRTQSSQGIQEGTHALCSSNAVPALHVEQCFSVRLATATVLCFVECIRKHCLKIYSRINPTHTYLIRALVIDQFSS